MEPLRWQVFDCLLIEKVDSSQMRMPRYQGMRGNEMGLYFQ